MTGFIIFYKRKSGESYITQYPDSAPSLASVKNPIPSISWESFTSPTIRTG